MTNGQTIEKFTAKAGEDISQVLSSYGMYRLPAFTDGKVVFRDGSSGAGKMNYNIFLGEIQFIDSKGDTLALANPETIDSVLMGSSLFYYKKGYLLVIANYDAAKLVMRQKIEFRPVKLGAYGNESPGSSIEGYGRVTNSPYANNNHLTLNEDIIVLKSTTYYLYHKRFRETEANRRGFQAAFPSIKEKMDAFIISNKIDFKKEPDLKQLLAFCDSQQ